MKIYKLNPLFTALAIITVIVVFIIVVQPVNAARTGGGSTNYFTSASDGYSTIYYNSGPVDVGSSASLVASFFVQGFSNVNIPIFAVATSTGQIVFQVNAIGSTTQIMQYKGFGTPTTATSSGIGTTGTSTLAAGSTDLAGNIYIFTGSSPAAGGTIASVDYASSTPPVFCTVSPMNSLTASGAASTTYIGTTTTGFNIKAVSGLSLTADSVYQWSYLCN